MIRALALVLFLALPAQAQEAPDPYDVVERAMAQMDAGDPEGVFATLNAGLRAGRASGFAHPDWGLVFALMADFYRNDRGNPGYALTLADEGLGAAAAAGPAAADVVSMLQVSRAYALADLGRLAEAAEGAEAALPRLRAGLGDEAAEDLRAEIAAWRAGAAGSAATDPVALARAALAEAGRAVDEGDFGRGLLLAARAELPEDTGLDPVEVRRLRAEAAMITGRALFTLGRTAEALEVLRRGAAAAVAWEESRAARTPLWRQDPGEGVRRLGMLFYWLGRAAMDEGLPEEAGDAFAIARAADSHPLTQTLAGFAQARLLQLKGDEAGSVVVLQDLAARAEAEGRPDDAATARFYIAMSRARTEGSPAALIALEEAARNGAAAKAAAGGSGVDQAFFLSEAGLMLVNRRGLNARALTLARAALDLRLAHLAQAGESAGGEASLRAGIAGDVATLLLAANLQASATEAARCPEASLDGCVIIVETSSNPER
jgi:hypothetical protein